jgi:hypothetical protein
LDFPLSSVITFTLKAGPKKISNNSKIFIHLVCTFHISCKNKAMGGEMMNNSKTPDIPASSHTLDIHYSLQRPFSTKKANTLYSP